MLMYFVIGCRFSMNIFLKEVHRLHNMIHQLLGIHTFNEQRIKQLALKVRVSRIMIRQPQCLANSGAWTNGMPMSLTLGCGTWGGNSVSENVGYKHLMNTTWVAWPIPSTEPKLEELFSKEVLGEVWD